MSEFLIVADLETSGLLDKHPDIQLAAIAVDRDWNEVDSFERKIQFDELAADLCALRMNHYDAGVWRREAVPEVKVVAEFAAFLKRFASIEMISKAGRPYHVARMMAFNAQFDAPRIKRMFERNNDAFLPAHPIVLCSLQLALWACRGRSPQPKNYKLGTLMEYFGLTIVGNQHDALSDVRSAAAIARVICSGREVAA